VSTEQRRTTLNASRLLEKVLQFNTFQREERMLAVTRDNGLDIPPLSTSAVIELL